MAEPNELPDERPQRRREYSGAGSTLGVAALLIVVVGLAIWFFEMRGDGGGAEAEAGFGIIDLPAELNTTGKPAAAEEGRAAPNFRLRTIDGGEASLVDYRGRYVLLNFWASWCGPCRAETPLLQAYSEEHPDGALVVGINQQESEEDARGFIEEFGVTYPQLLDLTGQVSTGYRVGRGLPVTFLIDPDGIILRVHLGQVTEEQLASLLAEAGS